MVSEFMRFLTEIVMYGGLALIAFLSYVITGWFVRFLKKHPRSSHALNEYEEILRQEEEDAARRAAEDEKLRAWRNWNWYGH